MQPKSRSTQRLGVAAASRVVPAHPTGGLQLSISRNDGPAARQQGEPADHAAAAPSRPCEPARDNHGSRIFSPQVWTALAAALKLTDRQLSAVKGVFDELSPRQIATTLGISHHTVNDHYRGLYHKLNVASHEGIVLVVFEAYLKLQGLAPWLSP